MKKLFAKFQGPGKIQYAQMLALSFYILIAWLHLGLLRPERFYFVIFFTCALDLFFNFLPQRRNSEGKIKFPITGFVAGSAIALLIETSAMPIYFLAGSIAILSKTLIRVENKHVLNPANLAVVATVILTGGQATVNIAQWSGAGWVLLLMGLIGMTVATLAKRIVLSCSYIFSFLILSLIYSLASGLPLFFIPGSLLGISTLLFAFHMLTDPMTSPSDLKLQMRNGVLIASVHLFLYANSVLYAQLLAALIVVSTITFLKSFQAEVPLTAKDPLQAKPENQK